MSATVPRRYRFPITPTLQDLRERLTSVISRKMKREHVFACLSIYVVVALFEETVPSLPIQ